MATLAIILETPLINFPLIINKHTLALPDLALDPPKINLIRILNKPNLISLLIDNLLHIDIRVAQGHVLDEIIAKLFLIFVEEIFYCVLLIAYLETEEFVI